MKIECVVFRSLLSACLCHANTQSAVLSQDVRRSVNTPSDDRHLAALVVLTAASAV